MINRFNLVRTSFTIFSHVFSKAEYRWGKKSDLRYYVSNTD